jgi:DNA processing protein
VRDSAENELVLAAFAAETGGHFVSEPRDGRYARFREQFDEAAFHERLAAAGIRWLPRSDPAFPAALRSIFDPPPGLFLRGAGEAALLDRPAVAIVGARACSGYGSHVARSFGRELAAAGLLVVSGLARGVDGEAHRGALDAGGTTVAVLGCGVDRDYPAAHRELARRICEDGLVVSEYAPGVEPAPWRFPARNRIIAGLAHATVVVEARERSGALITADLALEEGREVFAVPGEITSAVSAGANGLLRLGASAATSAADVLEAFGLVPVEPELPALSPAAEQVLVKVRDSPASADELARALGLEAAVVAAALAELELHELLTETSGIFQGSTRR